MNRLTEYKNIYCIGIGGIGVSAIAHILKSRGCNVTGSDMGLGEVTEALENNGIKVNNEHKAENISGADLVIYSAAIAEENPELKAARDKGIPCLSRAEVLGLLMEEFEKSIAVSGTHGKTSTTSMISLILSKAMLDPTILVGGNLEAIGGNVKIGKSPYFITEACEYRDSFLELKPSIEILLNIDSDHLDYFKDMDHIVDSFKKFTDLVPDEGMIVAYDANPFVSKVISDRKNTVTFGYSKGCDYHIGDVVFGKEGMPGFKIYNKDILLADIKLRVPGEHNIINASAAFACCHKLGVDADVIKDALEEFGGTHRRFDTLGNACEGFKVVDDYAHHPTEIKATLSAARKLPYERVICAFQPHTYTRTLALFDEFLDSFEECDLLIFAPIYAAREKDIYKISSKKLADAIKLKHPAKEVYYLESFEEIEDFIRRVATENDLVITMGAGDIYKVGLNLVGSC